MGPPGPWRHGIGNTSSPGSRRRKSFAEKVPLRPQRTGTGDTAFLHLSQQALKPRTGSFPCRELLPGASPTPVGRGCLNLPWGLPTCGRAGMGHPTLCCPVACVPQTDSQGAAETLQSCFTAQVSTVPRRTLPTGQHRATESGWEPSLQEIKSRNRPQRDRRSPRPLLWGPRPPHPAGRRKAHGGCGGGSGWGAAGLPAPWLLHQHEQKPRVGWARPRFLLDLKDTHFPLGYDMLVHRGSHLSPRASGPCT